MYLVIYLIWKQYKKSTMKLLEFYINLYADKNIQDWDHIREKIKPKISLFFSSDPTI